jgi:TonB-dependent receptor
MILRKAMIGLLASASASAFPAFAQTASDEIIVTGQRAAQARSIDVKRNTDAIIDVAAADEIGRLPDRNVAEVVERLPGVGVIYDQGEGRFVTIRGVPSDLNNYTVGGIEIGNPDGQTRSLPLDVISGQLLNRVEIIKAKTADLDGQGIGGTINLVPQTAFDFADPFTLQLNAQIGHQEIDDRNPIRGDASIAYRFGEDEKYGILFGVSYSERTYTSVGFFPDDWRPVAGAARGGLPINTKFTDYRLTRERIGAVASVDFRPSPDHSFYVRGIYSRFTEDEYRQRYRLDFATDALLASPAFQFDTGGVTGRVIGMPNIGTGNGTGAERRQDLRLEFKEKSITVGTIGGASRFGDVALTWAGAYGFNEVIEPNQLWQFRCNPGTIDFDFTDKIYTATPRTECGASQLNFRQYTRQDESGQEEIWQGKADAKWTIGGNPDRVIAFGGKLRMTDKFFDGRTDVWTRGANAASRFTLAQFNLAGPALNVFPDNSGRPFAISPIIDEDAIQAFTPSRLNGPLFVRDAAATLANASLNDVSVEEDVAAGYLSGTFKFGALTVIPGLRYERTTSRVRGLRLERGLVAVPVNARKRYDDWLPSLILRIDPSRDTVFRLAYTRNLGRPNYSQLSPGGALTFEDGNGDGRFEGAFSSGNPDLKPYRAHNFDASAEWYFARNSLVSVGVFAKFIDNPIFTQSALVTNTNFANRPFERLTTIQPLNADKGDIVGVELAFQTQFDFLPGLLSGFGIEANATFVTSNLRVPGGRTTTFPGQSKKLYGVQLFYQKGPVEASIAYHNTGAALLAIGGVDFQDQSSDDLRRLDAKVTLKIIEGVSVFFEAQNLTDEPTRFYQGDRPDWLIQNERYGRSFQLGASLKL